MIAEPLISLLMKVTFVLLVAVCGRGVSAGASKPALGCHSVRIGRAGLEGRAVDSADIAAALRSFLDTPVIDRVTLTGLFEVSVRWSAAFLSPRLNGPSAQSAPPSDDPDIYTALREQLGLKLEIERAQLTMMIIDSATMPEAN